MTNLNNTNKTELYFNKILDVEQLSTFHTPDGKPYIKYTNDRQDVYKIGGKSCKQLLQALIYLDLREAVSNNALDELERLLTAKALFDSPQEEIHLRLAQTDEGIEIDLNNDEGECVLVTKHEIVVTQPKSLFYRPDSMKSLPKPDLTGVFEDFKQHFHTRNEDDLRLIIGFMVQSLNPSGPYPLLIIQGEQGSAKTTTTNFVKALTDPSSGVNRSLSNSERDLSISAKNNHVMTFDNLSGLSANNSDVLCRFSTGGAFSIRANYTDDEELVFEYKRPVILNGIYDIITKPDLGSRSIIIHLPSISEKERKTEKDVFQDFSADYSKLFGYLLKGLRSGLINFESVKVPNSPRLADFVKLMGAAEEGLEWETGSFIRAMNYNQRNAVLHSLDNNPLAVVIWKFVDSLDGVSWFGTPTDLHERLMRLNNNSYVNSFPRSPGTLTNQLNGLAPSLKEIGILFEETRSGKTRGKRLTKMPNYVAYRFRDESDASDALVSEKFIYEKPPLWLEGDNNDASDADKEKNFFCSMPTDNTKTSKDRFLDELASKINTI